MAKGTICLHSIWIVLSVLSAVLSQQQQWMIRDPWGHAPIQRVPVQQPTYPQQTQYQQYPPRPQYPQQQPYQPYQPQFPPRPSYQQPPHWQTAQHVAQSGTNVATAAAAATTTPLVVTTALPVEVEPLEVEGPTTTTTTAAPYRYAPPWNQQQATSYNPPPQRTWGQPPQQPPQTNSWPSAPVQQAQPNAGLYQSPPNPAVPQGNAPHPTHGHYDYHPPQPANPQPPGQPGSANSMSRYDVFSTQFDANAFHAARQQAKVTTPDPMQALSQALGALGLGGAGGQGGGQWTNFGGPRTTLKPPTTTPDHRVAVNPYRQGGFYLAPTDFKARPKPTTQIMESRPIPDGVTFNPFDGFLGNTLPPEKKPTTAMPGKNGDHFAGFLGFNEITTPSPRADINIVNPKLSEFFAPVPILQEQPQQFTASQTQQQKTGIENILSQLSASHLAQALCVANPAYCPNQAPPAGKR